jgi:hypothetical protein
MTPVTSMTPIWRELRMKAEVSSPETDRIVAHTMKVINRQTAASEPKIMPM